MKAHRDATSANNHGRMGSVKLRILAFLTDKNAHFIEVTASGRPFTLPFLPAALS